MHDERAANTTDVSAQSSVGHVSRRVLVVDDNEAFLTSLSAVLRTLGHDVRAVSDGATGLEIAQNWLPEVVLLDVYLPSRTGFDIARELRRSFPPSTMRLIMMSGGDLDEDALIDAGHAGFDQCIGKFVPPAELDQILSADRPSGPATLS
jgi:CheY-like chemotaxis protein